MAGLLICNQGMMVRVRQKALQDRTEHTTMTFSPYNLFLLLTNDMRKEKDHAVIITIAATLQP